MTKLTLKILTSLSLALGLLGPQVASGAAPQAHTPAPVRASVGTVSFADTASQTVVVTTTQLDCAAEPVEPGRMDLLIWQACGSLMVQEQPEAPAIMVVSQPADIPTLAAAQSDIDWFETASLNKTNSHHEPLVIPATISLSPRSERGTPQLLVAKPFPADQQIISTQNSFTNISMRC